MSNQSRSTEHLCVVDPERADYAGLEAQALAAAIRWRHFRRAGEALRREAEGADQLWIVNARLPDMSGFELCEMLRRPPRSGRIVCVVSDAYSADDERAARASGASVYASKPLAEGFLACWLEALAPRAGTTDSSSAVVGLAPALAATPRIDGSRRGFVAARMPRRSYQQGTTS